MSNTKSNEEVAQLREEIKNLKTQLYVDDAEEVKKKTIPTVVLYKWIVPSRIFIKRDQKWFVSIAFVILVFIILFAFLTDILPIIVLITLMFLIYILGTVEPHDVTHEITNKGIHTMSKIFTWEELKHFWFAKQMDWIKLYIDTNLTFPGRLIMLVKPGKDKELFNILKEHLEYIDLEQNQSWAGKLLDGEYIKLKTYLPKQDVVEPAQAPVEPPSA